MREGKEGGISLRPKGASSQNWTTIATILASKCHHCERSSSQCFKLLLLCSFKPFFNFFDPEKFKYLYHRLLDLQTQQLSVFQNWTTITTILASKCHHCERSSSQCFKLMLLCSFKPFLLTSLNQTNFNDYQYRHLLDLPTTVFIPLHVGN